MPNPVDRQSALRAPFNELLGRESFVRVLRVLSRIVAPLSTGEIAEESRLASRSVREALRHLTDLGVVERLGRSRVGTARLDDAHPLAATLRQLFEAEASWFGGLLERLRIEVEKCAPAIRSAWVQGPVARGEDRFDDVLTVGVLASARDVDETVERLQSALTAVGGEQAVLVDVVGYTSADLQVLSDEQRSMLAQTIPLYGTAPLRRSDTAASGAKATTHDDLDERSASVARRLSERLESDPTLRRRALERVRRRLDDAPEGERRELREWLDVLQHLPSTQLRQLLLADTERAQRLRQSLPFVGLLDRRRDTGRRDPGAGDTDS